jgi:hypothetical protein
MTALAAGALTIAGCSSNSAPPQESSPQQPAPQETAAPAEHGGFAHCLGEHGVPAAPGPAAGPPPGVDADTWQKAMQACSTLAPGPGPG